MSRRARCALIVLCVLIAGWILYARVHIPRTSQVTLGQEFVLRVGDRAELAGTKTETVRLVAITQDGRCPKGMKCTATLPVTVQLALGATEVAAPLSIWYRDADDASACTTLGGHVLRLRDVQPWPKTRDPLAQEDYRVTFVIEATCGVKPRYLPKTE